jgi:CRISPR-associated protein Cas2
MLSAYRLMWVLVLFDLPVTSKSERKAAHDFRVALLDKGFEMTQFSAYMRYCTSKEEMKKYVNYIEANLPKSGKVYILHFTDKQYETAIKFSGKKREKTPKVTGQLRLF